MLKWMINPLQHTGCFNYKMILCFFLQSVFMFYFLLLQQTAVISLNSSHSLVFVMEVQYVSCEAVTDFPSYYVCVVENYFANLIFRYNICNIYISYTAAIPWLCKNLGHLYDRCPLFSVTFLLPPSLHFHLS